VAVGVAVVVISVVVVVGIGVVVVSSVVVTREEVVITSDVVENAVVVVSGGEVVVTGGSETTSLPISLILNLLSTKTSSYAASEPAGTNTVAVFLTPINTEYEPFSRNSEIFGGVSDKNVIEARLVFAKAYEEIL
jgi:hypothetical protein